MMTPQFFNIVAVFSLLCQQAFVESAVEEYSGQAEYSTLGMMLRRHIFKTITGAPLGDVCWRECYRDDRCQSFNYVISQNTCELNNRTKEARPEDFVPNSDRYYFKRDKDSVRLGSIPDLPAESCKEIKASEGEWAVNGSYWLLFLEIEKILLTYCDMKTEASTTCADIYKSGKRKSGVYTINPDGSGIIDVFCDQTTDGEGWLVFQKRQDGSVDFYRGWAEYKHGFGFLTGEFWLGLDKIHRLTSRGKHKLRVDLEDFAGNITYAEYDSFKVGSEAEKYQLSLGSYSGTAGNFLVYHNGQKFSSKDQDNDASKDNCATSKKIRGAWWYYDCKVSNLNGVYWNRVDRGTISWGNICPIKRTEMKIRPKDF